MTTPIPFIEGNSVHVRGLLVEDAQGPMGQWTNDREVTRTMYRGLYPTDAESIAKDIEVMRANPSEVEFAVIETATDRHVGVVGIHSLNWLARSCEFRILMGERDVWGKGYGTEATQLMVVYAFEVLNMHKVWLGVVKDNSAAVRCYEKAGFIQEGELRDEVYRNSQYYNAVRMSILRDEYDLVSASWDLKDKIRAQFPS